MTAPRSTAVWTAWTSCSVECTDPLRFPSALRASTVTMLRSPDALSVSRQVLEESPFATDRSALSKKEAAWCARTRRTSSLATLQHARPRRPLARPLLPLRGDRRTPVCPLGMVGIRHIQSACGKVSSARVCMCAVLVQADGVADVLAHRCTVFRPYIRTHSKVRPCVCARSGSFHPGCAGELRVCG